MKNWLTKGAFLAVIITFGLSVTGCKTQPVKDYETQPVPSSVASADEVRDAIRKAGIRLGWIMSADGDHKLKGMLNVRNKHEAIISIPYSTTGYSLIYQSSDELNYNPEDKTIHKRYNFWVQNLNHQIQVELSGIGL